MSPQASDTGRIKRRIGVLGLQGFSGDVGDGGRNDLAPASDGLREMGAGPFPGGFKSRRHGLRRCSLDLRAFSGRTFKAALPVEAEGCGCEDAKAREGGGDPGGHDRPPPASVVSAAEGRAASSRSTRAELALHT